MDQLKKRFVICEPAEDAVSPAYCWQVHFHWQYSFELYDSCADIELRSDGTVHGRMREHRGWNHYDPVTIDGTGARAQVCFSRQPSARASDGYCSRPCGLLQMKVLRVFLTRCGLMCYLSRTKPGLQVERNVNTYSSGKRRDLLKPSRGSETAERSTIQIHSDSNPTLAKFINETKSL